jgi:tRNA pseudouridine55 synthase
LVHLKSPPFHGLLVVEKPSGLTSRDVVDRALRWFPRGTRIGHTGTLDPLATGVLVLCVGSATRLAEYVQDMAKTYRARLILGARSDTDDADGTVEYLSFRELPPDRAAVAHCLREFIGAIDQVPPAYSAAKVSGRRAYDLARGGEEVALKPRRVWIYGIDLLAYDYPHLDLRVLCGKGTYIRSLARDLGTRLGRGAVVEALRRMRVGPFDEANALRLEVEAATARSALLPVSAAVAELPHVTLGPAEVARLRQGQGVPLGGVTIPSGPTADPGAAAVFDPAGTLVAVVAVDRRARLLRPEKVLAPDRPAG